MRESFIILQLLPGLVSEMDTYRHLISDFSNPIRIQILIDLHTESTTFTELASTIVLLDDREPNQLAIEVEEYGHEVEIKRLKTGDFEGQTSIGEIKRGEDFFASIVDRRIINQAKKMHQTGKRRFLILAGNMSGIKRFSEDRRCFQGGDTKNCLLRRQKRHIPYRLLVRLLPLMISNVKIS